MWWEKGQQVEDGDLRVVDEALRGHDGVGALQQHVG